MYKNKTVVLRIQGLYKEEAQQLSVPMTPAAVVELAVSAKKKII